MPLFDEKLTVTPSIIFEAFGLWMARGGTSADRHRGAVGSFVWFDYELGSEIKPRGSGVGEVDLDFVAKVPPFVSLGRVPLLFIDMVTQITEPIYWWGNYIKRGKTIGFQTVSGPDQVAVHQALFTVPDRSPWYSGVITAGWPRPLGNGGLESGLAMQKSPGWQNVAFVPALADGLRVIGENQTLGPLQQTIQSANIWSWVNVGVADMELTVTENRDYWCTVQGEVDFDGDTRSVSLLMRYNPAIVNGLRCVFRDVAYFVRNVSYPDRRRYMVVTLGVGIG